ncbi:TfoX/Sxy family DNA transformation protein [Maritimibacter sp. DP1N21-5]|uniref:TfoX/Sxy family DNA transformation protein n=1 Tax=Maritimibacter sp. DP1N21-5 TaxID=2836867 RepID=UPI001C46FDA5|nr:TfoX/Sxy family DNA transformation protein [Maritimibacter sp. DP1N21-5]MBV7409613.1 TfoX/Sxy family protein [Maritimibacter sp. DP1N21-5]
MCADISTLPNLGPATAAGFHRAGIASAEELLALGADEAYRRWLAAGEAPHFIGYYALVMGLQGRPWNDCRGAEKEALKLRFEALKDGMTRNATGFEAVLDEIGIRPRA